LHDSIEGIQKAAFSCFVQNQKYAELLSKPLPVWYNELKQVSMVNSSLESEISSLRSISTLSNVYGVSIMQPAHHAHSQRFFQSNLTTTDPSMEKLQKNMGGNKQLRDFLSNPLSRSFVAATKSEWGAQSLLDPSLAEISQDVAKLVSLKVPVNPPRLGSLRNRDGRFYSCHTPVMASPYDSKTDQVRAIADWKPKVDVLTCCTPPNEHSGPVSRLSVSQDQSFFVSGSHDGTCKVWETHQILDSAGDLCSSLTYDGHSNMNNISQRFGSRINDVCIIENSHSVASGDSNGAVQVWRVDTFAKNSSSATDYTGLSTKTSGVSGCTMLRKVDPCEGEILSVSHFNTSAASIIAFATHRGIHSWDLRCAYEPFCLNLKPEYGHVTSMAVGNDRNWIVAGSNRGYLALWDVRFQKLVKLWQHESGAPVNRLGTSFASLSGDSEPKPYVVMGCGLNETTVFDISRGSCSHCFRVLDPALCYMDQSALPGKITSLPLLREVNIGSGMKNRVSGANDVFNRIINQRIPPPEPSVQSFTGRVGTTGENYLITGGSDGFIHYWNFSSASKCFTVSGLSSAASRPVYEKVGLGLNEAQRNLFVCRQLPPPKLNEIPSVNISKALQRGPTRADNKHKDAILDIKKLEYPMKGLLSCSRDNSIKFWR
jgi:WD40 repeat protein